MAFSWPTIPEPSADPSTLLEPVRALKNIVETLTGQRATSNDAAMMRIFRSVVRPGAANSPVDISQIKDGDMWIDMGNSAKLNYWDSRTKVWMKTS